MRYHFLIVCCLASFAAGTFMGRTDFAAEPAEIGAPRPDAALSAIGLPDGWKKEVEIPESRDEKTGHVYQAASKLKLWAEKGWLAARYESSDRGLEWQVVLAQASIPDPPEIRIDKQPMGFEIKYERYFIREHVGWLSMFRQPKGKACPIGQESQSQKAQTG